MPIGNGARRHAFKTSHHLHSTDFSLTKLPREIRSYAAFCLTATPVVRPGKVSRQRFLITAMELR
jgi:hypothetical protein